LYPLHSTCAIMSQHMLIRSCINMPSSESDDSTTSCCELQLRRAAVIVVATKLSLPRFVLSGLGRFLSIVHYGLRVVCVACIGVAMQASLAPTAGCPVTTAPSSPCGPSTVKHASVGVDSYSADTDNATNTACCVERFLSVCVFTNVFTCEVVHSCDRGCQQMLCYHVPAPGSIEILH